MTQLWDPLKGDKITAEQHAEIVRLARRTFTGPDVMEHPGGFVFRRPRTRGGGRIDASFRLKQNGIWQGDYLWCRTWNANTETEGDEDVFIAKPPSLQRSTLDGKTRAGISYVYTGNVSRTATRTNGATEKQVVVDVYWIGDVIIATSPIKRGTGVVVEGVPLVWMDDNRAGRAFARKHIQ